MGSFKSDDDLGIVGAENSHLLSASKEMPLCQNVV
jgi:hypothetical protein